MSGKVFSVILLPTSECNVACDYCFEHKEPHRLSSVLVPLLTRRLLDHLEHEDIEECEIYWQGGEAMMGKFQQRYVKRHGIIAPDTVLLPPAWLRGIRESFARIGQMR